MVNKLKLSLKSNTHMLLHPVKKIFCKSINLNVKTCKQLLKTQLVINTWE